MKGAGALLGVQGLPFEGAVTVRLVRGDAPMCWEARYSTSTKNDGEQFKAKSD